ncbi:hypothetical protein LTR86_004354 [Recurvomyces mirabilis]|nr:hypothetical protein LTR86_004354 [Recurvomyces mirabilis]
MITADATAPTSTGQPLEQAIHSLSLAHITSFTTRNMTTNPLNLRIISPTLKGDFDNMPLALNASTHLHMVESTARQHPEWRVEVLSSCVGVDEEVGMARVWVTLAVSGLPHAGFENVRRESVLMLTWKREGDGRWLMSEQRNIRGPGRSLF